MPRTIAPEIIRRALPIFTNFLIRDYFDEELAIEEFARIAPNPSTGEFLSADDYVMGRRAGSAFTMYRANRLSVYASFENALNHAAVEIVVA